MSIYPEILAGYGAALKAVEGMAVDVHEPGVYRGIPSDPIEMIASGPAAYSILLMPLQEGINVCRHGRYGFLEDTTMVNYPVVHTDATFDDRLREVLRPVVEAELAKANEEKQVAITEHGPKGIEARDAVRRIG